MSVENLRNLSKRLHKSIHDQKPMTLMQVQHIVAQSHGFKNWEEALHDPRENNAPSKGDMPQPVFIGETVDGCLDLIYDSPQEAYQAAIVYFKDHCDNPDTCNIISNNWLHEEATAGFTVLHGNKLQNFKFWLFREPIEVVVNNCTFEEFTNFIDRMIDEGTIPYSCDDPAKLLIGFGLPEGGKFVIYRVGVSELRKIDDRHAQKFSRLFKNSKLRIGNGIKSMVRRGYPDPQDIIKSIYKK